MSESSEFFIDLTPKNSTPVFKYDNYESELLQNTQIIIHDHKKISISTTSSSSLFSENSEENKLPNDDSAISKTKNRFKFTIIKNNKNNTTSNSTSSRSSKKFNIIRVSQQIKNSHSPKNGKNNEDEIKPFNYSPRSPTNDDVILLF